MNAMEAQAQPCQRKMYVFAPCGHAYISPPCHCCAQPPQLAALTSSTDTASLSTFADYDLKTTRFRQQCAACQLLTIEIKIEIARQDYGDFLELWGEHDEEAYQEFAKFGKASKQYARLRMAIYRDSPNVDGWTQIYVGC